MGCYDIFCFICGNPNRHIWNEEYREQLSDLNLSKVKEDKIIKNFNQLIKNSEWLNNCTLLLENDKVIHDLQEHACNTQFRDKNNTEYDVLQSGHNKRKTPNGIFLHTDCWNFVKQKYKINLKCSDIYPYIEYSKKGYTTVKKIFGEIENYWGQDFDFIKIAIDNKNYLCSSPLKNDKNITQIKKNVARLKLKNDPKRKSPLCSATFYKEGDIKLGKNNKFWTIKKNKWLEITESLITQTFKINIKDISIKQKKFIEKIPYLGLHNKNPIFLKSINWTDTKCEIEFLSIPSYKINFL